MTEPIINIENLTLFLHKANKNTFANANAKKVSSTHPSSCDYHFEEGNFTYHDTYFGSRDFIGEEIVYQDQKPIWGMNYCGSIITDNATDKELNSFLETSIMQEYNDIIPVRGPREFSENNWTYKLTVDGELSRFTGIEEIFHDGKVVYRLFLHGGFLQ